MMARATFPITAGRFVRDDVIHQIRSHAMRLDLEVHISESRGWLSSDYTIGVKGAEDSIRQFTADFAAWAARFT